ncbi:AbrB/MazE/SpoVT family DNA-binding domain-containing protein [Candidatus Woesearchaeota archaeon]|nr:AbrB/MazE/SpoVT family DNA-binding domain-containing protein [Candidatus Woesearchaeota archaeon]
MDKPKFIGKAKISRQGQLTLPFEARQDLDIKLDSEVYWYEIDDCLIVTKELVNQKDLMKMVLNNKKRG